MLEEVVSHWQPDFTPLCSGFHHSYNVRVRPGWADLRSCLIQVNL